MLEQIKQWLRKKERPTTVLSLTVGDFSLVLDCGEESKPAQAQFLALLRDVRAKIAGCRQGKANYGHVNGK